MSGNYLWRNQLAVDLPMRMAQHDPVNAKTLNVGRLGSAGDATFGAGAATPTKLTTAPGYSFDGGDYMVLSSVDSSVWSLLFAAKVSTINATYKRLFAQDPTKIEFAVSPSVFGSVLSIYDGTAWRRATAPTFADGLIHTAVATYDGATLKMYQDGVENYSTAGVGNTLAGIARIGMDIAGTSPLTGTIHFSGVAPFALTPTQVLQYHREQMKGLHRL